jgi:hypothetical protein
MEHVAEYVEDGDGANDEHRPNDLASATAAHLVPLLATRLTLADRSSLPDSAGYAYLGYTPPPVRSGLRASARPHGRFSGTGQRHRHVGRWTTVAPFWFQKRRHKGPLPCGVGAEETPPRLSETGVRWLP